MVMDSQTRARGSTDRFAGKLQGLLEFHNFMLTQYFRRDAVPFEKTRDDTLAFARELARGRGVLAVGRVAEQALGAPYIRHPSHGGAADFRAGLLAFRPGGQRVRHFNVSGA